MTKRAKIIDKQTFTAVMSAASEGPNPARDAVMLLLSHRAGLRAAEIAGLTWGDMVDANGKISQGTFTVPASIAKKGHERAIPMHRELYDALVVLQEEHRKEGPLNARHHLMQGEYVTKMSANYVAVYIRRLYQKCGLIGCSSHSGRRSFVTSLARLHNTHDCSLKDVQMLAGHKHLSDTEAYIEPSEQAFKMVDAL